MDPSRPKSRLAPAMIAAGILCALPAAYIAGYFAFSHTYDAPGPRVRMFNAGWQAFIYAPAAWFESTVTGTPVYSGSPVASRG
jgi:hypothetical protein